MDWGQADVGVGCGMMLSTSSARMVDSKLTGTLVSCSDRIAETPADAWRHAPPCWLIIALVIAPQPLDLAAAVQLKLASRLGNANPPCPSAPLDSD